MPLQQPSATPEPQPEIRFDTVPLVATVTVTATAPAPVTEPAFGTQPAPAPGPAAEGDPLPGVMRTGQNWPWKLDGGTWSAEWTEADTPDRSGSAPDA